MKRSASATSRSSTARMSVDWRVGDAGRAEIDGRLGHRLATHEPVEQSGGFVTDLAEAGNNARQRRVGDLADRLVVVDADDGHLLGHGHARPTTGLQNPLSDRVVTDP